MRPSVAPRDTSRRSRYASHSGAASLPRSSSYPSPQPARRVAQRSPQRDTFEHQDMALDHLIEREEFQRAREESLKLERKRAERAARAARDLEAASLELEAPQSLCPACHRGLFSLTLLLSVLSVPLVYSASTAIALEHHDRADFFLWRQLVFALIGVCVLVAASRLPVSKVRAVVWVLYGVALAGLLATDFSPLGLTLGGVKRWVKFGPLPLQFSELAKIALIGVLADFWSRARSSRHLMWPWLVSFGLAMPIVALVFAQPHLSAAALLFVLSFCIAFFAGAPLKQMAKIIGVLALLSILVVPFLKPYQRERITGHFLQKKDERGANYQALQGQRALTRGGVFGTGPGGSLFKQGHLPAPHTDFILAIIGEEWGFVGMFGLLLIYGAMIFFCFHTGHCARDMFAALLCAGVGTLLTIQLVCNAGVVSGLMPVTGMPLPLLSYGGSGLLCTLFGIGLVLSVSRQVGEAAGRCGEE